VQLNDANLTIQQLRTELAAFQLQNLPPAQTREQEGAEGDSAVPGDCDRPEVQSELFVLESQIVELVKELKEMKIALALRDDEIRGLRIVELGDLEDKLAESRREAAQLSAQLADREPDLGATWRGNVGVGLAQQTSTLKKELDQQAALLRRQERQLKEARADVAIRSQQLAAKQANEEALQDELRQLQSVVASLQEDHSRSLENATRMETVVLERATREDELRARVKSMEAHGASLDSGTMGVNQELPGLQARVKELETEMERQKMEWSAKEVGYLNELNDERSRREALERQDRGLGCDKPATKVPAGGTKVLREKSNSSRFGFTVSERQAGRKTHRSSASEPTIENLQALK
jgi:chromosome segregation ATPase